MGPAGGDIFFAAGEASEERNGADCSRRIGGGDISAGVAVSDHHQSLLQLQGGRPLLQKLKALAMANAVAYQSAPAKPTGPIMTRGELEVNS